MSTMVEVIVVKNTEGLGEMGKTLRVRAGFARNYLIPKGLAVVASAKLAKQLAHSRRVVEGKIAKTRSMAEIFAKQINHTKLVLERKSGEQGKLFGSVTAGDIADALLAKKIEVDKKQIVLDEGPIKQLGKHKVSVRLFTGVEAQVLVEIVAEKGSENASSADPS